MKNVPRSVKEIISSDRQTQADQGGQTAGILVPQTIR